MPQYDTVSEVVDVVQWDGSNVDEVITLVGISNVALTGGHLQVYGKPVPVLAYVVQNANGTLREITQTIAGSKYTPHQA